MTASTKALLILSVATLLINASCASQHAAPRGTATPAENATVLAGSATLITADYATDPNKRKSLAATAQAQVEAVLAHASENARGPLLITAAKAAFEAAHYDAAKRYATEVLSFGHSGPTWNQGNALHHGNLILGRIALHDGNQAQAVQYLLEAGKTPGSPQLDSFGPNMALANDLLKRGDRTDVLRYLEEVAMFWHDPKLQQWRARVNTGQTPNFGANLYY